MRHSSTLGLVVTTVTSMLGGCADPGTAPNTPQRPSDSVSTATAQRTYLSWFDLTVTRLGVSPTGDTTPGPPLVQVVDYRHRAVANVTVNFAVVSGGGTLAVTQAVSSGNGFASARLWRLGPAAGLNVVRATSPSNSDTVYFKVNAVDVDTSPPEGRFLLERLDSQPLPTAMPWGYMSGAELVSAAIEVRGSQFVLTWNYRFSGGSQAESERIEGGVERRGPYFIFVMSGLNRADASAECPSLLLADGHLRLANFVEDWPIGGRYQDFKRAP